VSRIDNLTLELSKDFKNQIQNYKRNLDLIFDNNNDVTVSDYSKEEEDNNTKDVVVYADKERIAQVLINLVDNAIKNTDSGKIIITITKANLTDTETRKFLTIIKR
jgi:signal transduction histidine kinase